MFVVAFLFLDVTWVVIRGVVNICIQGIVSIQGACLLNPVHCISPECYFNPGRVDIPNVFEFWHCRVPFAVLSLALYVYWMVLARCRSDDARRCSCEFMTSGPVMWLFYWLLEWRYRGGARKSWETQISVLYHYDINFYIMMPQSLMFINMPLHGSTYPN